MFARYILFFSALCIAVLSWSQHHSAFYSINPDRVNDVTEKNGCKAFSIEWDNPAKEIKEESYHFVLRPPASFTAFGAGISTVTPGVSPLDFSVDYRTLGTNAKWSTWKTAMVETTPEETPTGMFWTELMFAAGENPEHAIELRIHISSKVTPASIRLELMDITSAERKFEPAEKSGMRPGGCPPFPTVIDRSVWLEPYYGTQSYTPTVIYPTHCVVHHGASPDTYTDGAAVVRSYWNYHVNTLGWSDIGYNWLFDKYGNIYQGRKNSDMINLDVQGAHAGASNPYSIGVNFLGNADVTTPTAVQLNSLYAFLGWWFDTRGYDPTTSASLVLQSGGTATVPRILGHKDTNIGGTSCPGDTLYGYLPTIRIQTKAVIDACMTAPSTAVSTTGNWQTGNFTATFYDTADAGLQMPFYQVLEYQGGEWRANGNSGFFNDNFDNAIHSDWTNISGNWSINSGYLNQTNEDSSNTNLYIPLNQQSGNVYLYHFWMRISGSGTN
ncbi:MAG: peptidoglycan recognition family protein, partial [Bacteroidota bacterium]